MFRMNSTMLCWLNKTTIILGASFIGGLVTHGYLTKPNNNGRFQIISPQTDNAVSGIMIVFDSATGNSWIKNIRDDLRNKQWTAHPLPSKFESKSKAVLSPEEWLKSQEFYPANLNNQSKE